MGPPVLIILLYNFKKFSKHKNKDKHESIHESKLSKFSGKLTNFSLYAKSDQDECRRGSEITFFYEEYIIESCSLKL